jgi:putative zinc finger protein
MNGKNPNAHLPERLIDAYVDGDLDRADREAVETHVAGCPDCRLRVEEYQNFFAALDMLPIPEVPAGFAVRILDAVLPPRAPERKLVRLVTRAYAGVAVALSAVAAVVLGMSGPGPFTALLAEGWSRSVGDGLVNLRNVIVGGVDLVLALAKLAPLANVGRLLLRVLETVALAIPPQQLVLGLLSVSLAVFVLIWAMASARERGVPHASLFL